MTLAKKIQRPATLDDLKALPPNWRGEIIEGTLYAFPRPRFGHSRVQGRVHGDLEGPFDRGRGGGPGGWIILFEPSIELPGSPEISPDLAGWRRDRMPRPPKKNAPITLVPDWVCEVFSPSTRGYDEIVKRRFYAKVGVPHLWYIDPEILALRVLKLVNGEWVERGAYGPDEKVQAEPFEAIEIDLAAWWEGLEDEETDEP